MIEGDGAYLHFSAETSNFSVFAIMGRKKPFKFPTWIAVGVIAIIIAALVIIVWWKRALEKEWIKRMLH